MVRQRKRHVQQKLRFTRGGSRPGAGRPKKGARASERHKVRPPLKKHEPVHVVIRAHESIRSLRTRDTYQAIRAALVTTFARESFHVVHLSIQGTHVHLLAEADNRMALARGMQAFQISAAMRLNAALSKQIGMRRRGAVFPDRYHAEIITSPRRARHALAYVLNNWRKHREDRANVARGWTVDLFSTAPSFEGWRDWDASMLDVPETYNPLPVWKPRTWLLCEGWRKHGLIATTEVPGKRSRRPRAPRIDLAEG
jgi:REP element-mobilizing transposase RayT